MFIHEYMTKIMIFIINSIKHQNIIISQLYIRIGTEFKLK